VGQGDVASRASITAVAGARAVEAAAVVGAVGGACAAITEGAGPCGIALAYATFQAFALIVTISLTSWSVTGRPTPMAIAGALGGGVIALTVAGTESKQRSVDAVVLARTAQVSA